MVLRAAVLTALLFVAAVAQAAAATTVSYNTSTGLTVESTAGESNVVRIFTRGGGPHGFRVSDVRAGVAAGPGCAVIATAPDAVTEGDTVACQFSPAFRDSVDAVIRLGSGNDELVIDQPNPSDRSTTTRPFPVQVFAGPGNDIVTSDLERGTPTQQLNGEEGDDQLTGNIGADVLDGGPGNDTLVGGVDADTLRGGDGDDVLDGAEPDMRSQPSAVTNPFADSYDGGAGRDRVDYSARAWYEAVNVDLNTGLGGQAGENDSIKGVEDVTGGRGNDTLAGNDAANGLRGGPGNDTIDGGKGDDDLGADALTGGASGGEPGVDQIKGGEGNDALRGGDAGDKLLGGPGNDAIDGGDGSDDLLGEDGADTLVGGLEADALNGGRDNDTIDALDAIAEKVTCGSGSTAKGGGPDSDSVRIDLKDENPGDCENLTDGAINEGPYVGMRTASSVFRLDPAGAATVTLVCPRKLRIGCVGSLRAGLEAKPGRIASKLGPAVRYRLRAGQRAVLDVRLPKASIGVARRGRARAQLVTVEKGSFGDKRRVRTMRVRAQS